MPRTAFNSGLEPAAVDAALAELSLAALGRGAQPHLAALASTPAGRLPRADAELREALVRASGGLLELYRGAPVGAVAAYDTGLGALLPAAAPAAVAVDLSGVPVNVSKVRARLGGEGGSRGVPWGVSQPAASATDALRPFRPRALPHPPRRPWPRRWARCRTCAAWT
jgi:hypothetical protein